MVLQNKKISRARAQALNAVAYTVASPDNAKEICIMAVFYKANGEGFCMELNGEQMERIGTWENLLKILKRHHNTEDVVIEGKGEA